MFAMLGGIRLGTSAFTGPTAGGEGIKAAFAQHKVAEGKPVPQDMGDDLATKTLDFFFDEGFCDPVAELAKLEAARLSRQPLPYVTGAGQYFGQRFWIESLSMKMKRTTPAGRLVRLDASLSLIEVPVRDLAAFAAAFAQATAPAASSAAGLDPGARRT